MRRRHLVALGSAACLTGAVTMFGDGPAQSGTTAYLTISFGRTQWVQTDPSCEPMRGAVPLRVVARAMAKRGLSGVGNVVVGRTAETRFTCVGHYYRSPGWDRLTKLRDRYGWSFVSASMSDRDVTALSRTEQTSESCGSLDALSAHGHDRAWGLFAYPGNRFTTQIQSEVVSRCFAYGRRYGPSPNERSQMRSPWFARSDSVNGGSCNRSDRPCYAVAGAPHRYRSPADLGARVGGIGRDEWLNLQFYRLVRGSYSTVDDTERFRWDCTSRHWRLHWTSRTELYCFNDFLEVLDAVGRNVTVTDPATVAEAWGRTPPFG